MVLLAGALLGAAWLALAGVLRQWRGVNETISSLLLGYIAIALFKHFVEGPLRDPASLNKPSTHALDETLRIGAITADGLLAEVHWGLIFGLVACIAAGVWLSFTAPGFALRVVGGNARTARLVGLPTDRLIVLACALGGACAGLAGAIEVAAVHTSANASVIAGLGYTGILVSFVARHNPWAIPPVALLFGGFAAAGSLLQRRLGLPDASVLVLQGFAFVLILAAEALRGRLFDLLWPRVPRLLRPVRGGSTHVSGGAWFDVMLAIVGGAVRVGTPFLFVSLGECLTEKSGRINLGLEGVLVFSAMCGFGASYLTASPWIGVMPPARAAHCSRCCTACCARCRA